MALIEPLLPHTDCFMPSEEEAMTLSGLTDFDAIADFLLEKGIGCVILTLGQAEALYRHCDGTRFRVPAKISMSSAPVVAGIALMEALRRGCIWGCRH